MAILNAQTSWFLFSLMEKWSIPGADDQIRFLYKLNYVLPVTDAEI
jgi:hypothetical protein